MLTPAFHFKILENFLEVFSEKSEILVRKLQKEIGPQSFDIYPYINSCTLDVICSKVFLLPSFQYVGTTVVL
jgi:cytochrome P450 family 4